MFVNIVVENNLVFFVFSFVLLECSWLSILCNELNNMVFVVMMDVLLFVYWCLSVWNMVKGCLNCIWVCRWLMVIFSSVVVFLMVLVESVKLCWVSSCLIRLCVLLFCVSFVWVVSFIFVSCMLNRCRVWF